MAAWSCDPIVKLFILRHADAEVTAESDELRALTPKGQEQARRMAELCKHCGQTPEVILHSPLLRARETAEIFSQGIELPRLIEVPWLACGMPPAAALAQLRSYEEFSSVLLVGHEPDLSHLIAHCLGLPNPAALHVRKASLACLSLADLEPGSASLEFLIPVKLLKP